MYFFKSRYKGLSTNVKIDDKFVRIEFENYKYFTESEKIANELRKYPNKSDLWEVVSNTTNDDPESLKIKFCERVQLLELNLNKMLILLQTELNMKSETTDFFKTIEKMNDSELLNISKKQIEDDNEDNNEDDNEDNNDSPIRRGRKKRV